MRSPLHTPNSRTNLVQSTYVQKSYVLPIRKMAYSVYLHKKLLSNIQAEGSYQLPYHRLMFLPMRVFLDTASESTPLPGEGTSSQPCSSACFPPHPVSGYCEYTVMTYRRVSRLLSSGITSGSFSLSEDISISMLGQKKKITIIHFFILTA